MGKLRRRGQVFLIMTILVVSFMVGITSILLDVKQADYIEPAPDANQTLRAWEITVDSINNIMEIYLSKLSNGQTADIVQPINNLEQYLTHRGISNSIVNITLPDVSLDDPTDDNTATHSVSISFNIFLASSSTTIEQTIDIEISYTASETTTAGLVEIYKVINGETTFITGCQNDNGATDNGDGTYTTPTGSITFTTPENVNLEVTIP